MTIKSIVTIVIACAASTACAAPEVVEESMPSNLEPSASIEESVGTAKSAMSWGCDVVPGTLYCEPQSGGIRQCFATLLPACTASDCDEMVSNYAQMRNWTAITSRFSQSRCMGVFGNK
ncbi:MAG: hypothetical protein JST00_13615 [Deltaproteobacteria bacterium]|nr:hypothetical protein [Deltaproteobacteria bacterium]